MLFDNNCMSRTGHYLPYGVAVLACIGGRCSQSWPLGAVRRGCSGPYRRPLCAVLDVACRMVWLFWPVSVAVMSRIGRYLLPEVAVLARIGGRYEPCWPRFAVWRGCSGPYRWPLRAVLAAICCMKWLLWPVSVAVMSRVGRCLLYEVAVLARTGGRHEPCWPLFAVWPGCSGPYGWPL